MKILNLYGNSYAIKTRDKRKTFSNHLPVVPIHKACYIKLPYRNLEKLTLGNFIQDFIK